MCHFILTPPRLIYQSLFLFEKLVNLHFNGLQKAQKLNNNYKKTAQIMLQKMHSAMADVLMMMNCKGMLFYESRPCKFKHVWQENLNSGCPGYAGLDGRIQILFSRNKYSSPQGQLYYINKPLVISHYFIEKGRCYDSPTYIAML